MPGTAPSASAAGQLQLDVAVQLGEALFAGELAAGWPQQPRQDQIAGGPRRPVHEVTHGSSIDRPPAASAARSFRRAS